MDNNTENKFNGLDTFEHVVVLMLENRSFDNLLGFLDQDERFKLPDGKTFSGLNDPKLEVPVPTYAKGYAQNQVLKPIPVQHNDFSQPFPDPGEVYQHVNTQLYDTILPNSNKGIDQTQMTKPYNIPDPLPPMSKRMQGAVKDYINTLQGLWYSKIGSKPWWRRIFMWKKKRQYGAYKNPGIDQYGVIMQCFTPKQVPVLSTLACEFAVFDHWFCSVPSQTWCNRAFWHAGTSGGQVVNPTDEATDQIWHDFHIWRKQVWSQPTLFDRMAKQHVSHHVYANPLVCLTQLVHGFSHHLKVVSNEHHLKEFERDINGKSDRGFAKYSFIEPRFFGKHNDQHPSSVSSGWYVDDGKTREGTVRLGEELIRRVYNIIKDSPHRDDTLLIITHDEHGGCYDHIYPGSTEAPDFPHPGQKGFDFKRLGIRVPMVMVASSIPKNTVINEVFDHTSFIKTMCKKWGLEGLQTRDKSPNTNTFGHVFSRTKRMDWPDLPLASPPIRPGEDADYHNDPLNELQRTMLMVATKIARENAETRKQEIRTVDLDKMDTVKEAMDYLVEIRPLIDPAVS
ncbi:MAG: hypothetical protein KTR30_13215 [Saprospiraceae bacterium]|nr:hypothetical protein [Saprospiraceae bacterium]